MIKEDFVYADENHDNMIDWEEVAANRCLQFWNPLPVYFRLGRFTATNGHFNFLWTKSVNDHDTPIQNVEEDGYDDWPVNI